MTNYIHVSVCLSVSVCVFENYLNKTFHIHENITVGLSLPAEITLVSGLQ